MTSLLLAPVCAVFLATSSFSFFFRAFREADSGINQVLIREPKLAAMERLAEAFLWCLANLSLEGVQCWLGLPGSPQDSHPADPWALDYHLACFEGRVFPNRTTQELKENKPAKFQGDSQEAQRRIREQRDILICQIHIQANTDWEMCVCLQGLWAGISSSFWRKSHSGKGTTCNFKLCPRKEGGLAFTVFAVSGS